MKTWFITGISRGLGLELAQAALDRGDTVIGTVRDKAPTLRTTSGTLHTMRLDVADATAIDSVIERTFSLADQIDVVVNNAGYGLLGSIESASDGDITSIFNVNFLGPLRVIRAALPHLRSQRRGHIVNITSIAGWAPMAGSGIYAAAKCALEGLSESLAQEVKPFGISVTSIAPGAFRTDFLSAHSIRRSDVADAYDDTVGAAISHLNDVAGKQIGDPVRGAAAILMAVDSPMPPLHVLLGSDALRRVRTKLDTVIGELNDWETVARGTDFARERMAQAT